MQLEFHRTVDPTTFESTTKFSAVDVENVWDTATEPDKVLFYDLFGPDFEEKPVSEQLMIQARFAQLVEVAKSLNTEVRAIEKGGV